MAGMTNNAYCIVYRNGQQWQYYRHRPERTLLYQLIQQYQIFMPLSDTSLLIPIGY
jgi:hypothetical protein